MAVSNEAVFYIMIKEIDKLKSFETFRKESIDLLEESKIDKDSFFIINLDYIRNLDLKPFGVINEINQAIYNYQYYNLLAKKANFDAQKLQNNNKKKKIYNKLINDRENYYYLKDIATISLLEILNYENVESYYIILKSKRLQGEIFEIYISSIEKVILHSKNKLILQKLKENNVFCNIARESLIDSYVNKSY